jgi:DNA gyrase subunit B
MQELIRAGRVYVAQPPLYQVTRRKKSEYVLNERTMRKTLTALGTDGTTLAVRDENGVEIRRITGDELQKLVETLNRLEELVTVVQRRGIDFAKFLERRENGQALPHFRLVVDGEEHYFETAEQRDQYLRGLKLLATEEAAVDPTVVVTPAETKARDSHWQRLQKNQELHEVKELERLFAALDSYDLSIDDYYLTQEESVSGEKLATKYVLLNDSKQIEVAGVSQMMTTVHALAKQGIEVKRFKGLGEMNSEELWETTLDPSKRVLLRVKLEEAAEAERMFSVLMGEDVERRRQFIEEHALEVKNLDV